MAANPKQTDENDNHSVQAANIAGESAAGNSSAGNRSRIASTTPASRAWFST